MSFLAQDPLKREEMNGRPNYIQGGAGVQQGKTLTDTVVNTVAPKVMESVMTSGANALATPTLTAGLGQAVGGTAVTGGMGAAMGAMAGPVGMAAMLALPYLFKNGTASVPGYMNGTASVPGYMNGTQGVPEIDYGPDPLQGYMNGTNSVPGYMNGTNSVPGYMNGTGSINSTTAMHLAGGEDTVPALLREKEAIIPAAAAQNPKNIPFINAMIDEGQAANAMATGEPMPQDETTMAGPLSAKAQREEMKTLQDMSLKKKAWEAEESRKQKAFEQKYAHNDMKAMLSMRQS